MTSETPPEPEAGEAAIEMAAPKGSALALEFDLPVEAAGTLARHKALRAKLGRGRKSALELVWQDTADGRLARTGVVMEQGLKGERRLVTLLPLPGKPSRPARPCESVVLEDGSPDPANGASLMPVAAFAGEERSLVISVDGLPVTVLVRQGSLRSVAGEAPAARLGFEGPAGACLSLAREIAADIALLPSRAGLAEAGRSLALGSEPRARRRGPPDLSSATQIGAALEAALGHFLEVLVFHAPQARLGQGPEGVHQMRVAARRARSVLKVFKPVASAPLLDRIDTGLRALAGALGPGRDWDVFIDGVLADLQDALGDDKRLAGLARAAEGRRAAGYALLRGVVEGPDYRLLLLDLLAASLGEWRAEAVMPDMVEAPLPPFAAAVLAKRWRRLVKDAEDIEALPDEALHALRLKGKRLRYASELFAPLWPGKSTRRFLRRLSALQEALGIANDTSVARGLAANLAGREAGRAWAGGMVEGWALARGRKARSAAIEAWHEFERADRFWDDD